MTDNRTKGASMTDKRGKLTYRGLYKCCGDCVEGCRDEAEAGSKRCDPCDACVWRCDAIGYHCEVCLRFSCFEPVDDMATALCQGEPEGEEVYDD